MLKRVTSWSFRHRRLVVVTWIVVLVGINFAAMTFGGEDKQDFLSPGPTPRPPSSCSTSGSRLRRATPSRSSSTTTPAWRRLRSGRWSTRWCSRFDSSPHRGRHDAVGDSGLRPDLGRRHDRVRHRASRQHERPVPDQRRRRDDRSRGRRRGLNGAQVELAGQAIDNAQTGSIGSEGPGLLVAAIILFIAFGSLVAMGLPLATALFGVGVGSRPWERPRQRRRHP